MMNNLYLVQNVLFSCQAGGCTQSQTKALKQVNYWKFVPVQLCMSENVRLHTDCIIRIVSVK